VSDVDEAVWTGRVWSEFCRALEAAGQVVLAEGTRRPAGPGRGVPLPDPADQGDALLLRGQRGSGLPRFHELDLVKIGADNPDNVYLSANIRGNRTYRITGRRDTIAYFSIGSKANRYAKDGTMASTGELTDADLVAEPDGSIEIIASATRQGRNWLPLAPDSTGLVIRQTYLDRAAETPGSWHIAQLGGPERPGELTPEFLATALRRAALSVHGTAATFARWTELFMSKPNELPDFGQEMYQRAGGDPEISTCTATGRCSPARPG